MVDSAVVEIKVQEHSSRTMLSIGSEAASSLDHHNLTALRNNETVSCRNEFTLKARKPYTITKQREKWTDEDHKRFVEALKLYGRAWRRIEEHVGTKTAVQIRSHAQKFFSKAGRESDANFKEPIEIPPPRPKRKPMHPYPRKLVIPSIEDSYMELVRTKSILEKENLSATSVLSVVGSDALGFSASNSPRSSPDERYSLRQDLVPSEELTDGASVRRVKLFGKTVLVADYHISPSQGVSTCKSLCSAIKSKPIQPVAREFIPREVSSIDSGFSWPIAWDDSSIVQAKETKHHRRKSSTGSNSGSVNYTEDVEENVDVETQSSRCSSNDEEMELTRVSEFRTSERSAFSRLRPNLEKKTLKGFVPCKKRRIPGAEETNSSRISPHKGLQPETSLCL